MPDIIKGGGKIAVDLDGTLAHHTKFEGTGIIGNPIPTMVGVVKGWLDDGKDVVIFTARVASTNPDAEKERAAVAKWCEKHIGRALPVTAEKTPSMVAFYDDRAFRVERNTGVIFSYDEEDAMRVREETKYRVVNGTSYSVDTPQEVIDVLERAMKDGTRLEIYYGDAKTGKPWGDVERGTISRSTGPVKIPILVKTNRSLGGGGILSTNIVMIKDVKTGRTLYGHSGYGVRVDDPTESVRKLIDGDVNVQDMVRNVHEDNDFQPNLPDLSDRMLKLAASLESVVSDLERLEGGAAEAVREDIGDWRDIERMPSTLAGSLLRIADRLDTYHMNPPLPKQV